MNPFGVLRNMILSFFRYPSILFWLASIIPILSSFSQHFVYFFMNGWCFSKIPTISDIYGKKLLFYIDCFSSLMSSVGIVWISFYIRKYLNISIKKEKSEVFYKINILIYSYIGISLLYSTLLLVTSFGRMWFGVSIISIGICIYVMISPLFHLIINQIGQIRRTRKHRVFKPLFYIQVFFSSIIGFLCLIQRNESQKSVLTSTLYTFHLWIHSFFFIYDGIKVLGSKFINIQLSSPKKRHPETKLKRKNSMTV